MCGNCLKEGGDDGGSAFGLYRVGSNEPYMDLYRTDILGGILGWLLRDDGDYLAT